MRGMGGQVTVAVHVDDEFIVVGVVVAAVVADSKQARERVEPPRTSVEAIGPPKPARQPARQPVPPAGRRCLRRTEIQTDRRMDLVDRCAIQDYETWAGPGILSCGRRASVAVWRPDWVGERTLNGRVGKLGEWDGTTRAKESWNGLGGGGCGGHRKRGREAVWKR